MHVFKLIHFNFTVCAEDAENLLSLFGLAISNDQSMIIDEMSVKEPNQDVIDAIRADIKYLEDLKSKLTYSIV